MGIDTNAQGVGGEYPASSTSASEAANERSISQRGPLFIMVTNFVLSVRFLPFVPLPFLPQPFRSSPDRPLHYYYFHASLNSPTLQFGGPLAVAVFLIVLSAAGEDHLPTVWRVCFGIGVLLPLTVFYFRVRMLTTRLYRDGAIKREWMGFIGRI